MNIVLFGPPGAGKGTQSSLLVQRKNMRHLSTGDMFRRAIEAKTALGQMAKSFIDKGELVPDHVTVSMVENELKTLEGSSFILDGFPRNISQADSLEEMLKKNAISIDAAIFLEVPSSVLEERLTGRRVCKSCGALYHVSEKPPKVAGTCDRCGGEVYQRSDDRAEVIRGRLEVYEKNTMPLKSYYRAKGKLVEVNGQGDAESVFVRLSAVIGSSGQSIKR